MTRGWHGVRAALCCGVLLSGFGCAAPHVATRSERPIVEGALYDPAAEWAADHRSPVSPRRTIPRLIRRPRYVEYDAPQELRSFNRGDRERIAAIEHLVARASHSYGIPRDLIFGIIWVESRFVVRATGERGPTGLMQVMPRTGREVAQQIGRRYHAYDPEFNVHAGTYYFARMIERFDGNLRLALAAYNIGPGTVQRWLDTHSPLPERSERYIDNVFTAARAFRARGF